MTRKCQNHIPQPNPKHRDEETQNTSLESLPGTRYSFGFASADSYCKVFSIGKTCCSSPILSKTYLKPPFHWTAIPLRSWRSRIFSKIIPNRRGSVGNHTIWGLDLSSTLPLRCCYDPTTTMKIWLRLVYADGDVAATLLRPWRWSYAFVAFLYPFYSPYLH